MKEKCSFANLCSTLLRLRLIHNQIIFLHNLSCIVKFSAIVFGCNVRRSANMAGKINKVNTKKKGFTLLSTSAQLREIRG